MSDDTPWLSDAERETWVRLTGVIMTLPSAIDAQLKRDSCLNFFEYSILVGLDGAPGRTMQLSQLADYANGSQSRLSHAVSRMERAGWVERRAATCEVRAVHAVMTENGRAKLVAAAPGHVREVRRLIFDALGPGEHERLNEICRQMLTVLLPQSPHIIDVALATVNREQARQ